MDAEDTAMELSISIGALVDEKAAVDLRQTLEVLHGVSQVDVERRAWYGMVSLIFAPSIIDEGRIMVAIADAGYNPQPNGMHVVRVSKR